MYFNGNDGPCGELPCGIQSIGRRRLGLVLCHYQVLAAHRGPGGTGMLLTKQTCSHVHPGAWHQTTAALQSRRCQVPDFAGAAWAQQHDPDTLDKERQLVRCTAPARTAPDGVTA